MIEYENLLGEPEPSGDAIEAYQAWAEPLIAKIREEWPASTLRILLHETVGAADDVT